MKTILIIGSLIGLVNGFILIGYAYANRKNGKSIKLLFSLLFFALFLRLIKYLLQPISDDFHALFFTIGILGFMIIGPAFYWIQRSLVDKNFSLKWRSLLHLVPAIIFCVLWSQVDMIRSTRSAWQLFYQSILLQYMIYVLIAIFNINFAKELIPSVKKQLNVYAIVLLTIWFAFLLGEVAGVPYLAAGILYTAMLAISVNIILKKGYLIDLRNKKYKKTGLKLSESQRIKTNLSKLIEEDKIYTDNLISLPRLAKKINSSTHAVSQVINEQYQQSFFELIASLRIEEAKEYLVNKQEMKISDVAYSVGYNSLSAFNTAFKKHTGITPGKYRNEH